MKSRHFPFYDLGFRCNPFRVLTEDEWRDIAVLPPIVEAALENEVPYLQIMGDMGRGKSTTLHGVAAHLKRQHQRVVYEYLPEGHRRFKSNLSQVDVFLLDEAQRLWPWERRRLIKLAKKYHLRLIIGTHEDFSILFRRHQLQFETVCLDSHEGAEISKILARRLAYFSYDTKAPIYFELDSIDYLSEAFGTDLRTMQYFLYEVFQHLEQPMPLSAKILQQMSSDLEAIK